MGFICFQAALCCGVQVEILVETQKAAWKPKWRGNGLSPNGVFQFNRSERVSRISASRRRSIGCRVRKSFRLPL